MDKGSRRVAAYVIYVGLVAAPFALAGDVALPYEFENGQTAYADQVNDNFDALADAVNDNDARLLDLEEGISFHAAVSGGSNESTGVLVFDDELHDDGGGYDPATGVFTAPQSGTYQLNFHTAFISTGIIRMRKNADTALGSTWSSPAGMNGSVVITTPLAKGDTVDLFQTPIDGNASVSLWGTTTWGPFTAFSGHRIGP